MLRHLLPIVLLPAAGLLAWLALGTREPRADFVFTCPEPRTLDPQRVSWLAEIQLAAAMFEGLTRLNADTFAPEPAVARSWETASDPPRYTFHLRPEARWSNGEPVTAEDFRAAWLRALDPQCEAQYAGLLFAIQGAAAYYSSRSDADATNDQPPETVGVVALDERTLRVTLAGPCPYFLELTSFITLAPAHRPTLARWAYRDGRVLRSTQHLSTRPENIVCNGPFVLDRWDFKQRVFLRRNPHYWDADSIALSSLEALITSDTNAALLAYQTGRADLVSPIERSVAQLLRRAQQAGRRSDFHSSDRFATFFYRVNCRRPPLDDANLRKALSLALDRDALCAHVLQLGETPAYTYVPVPALSLMDRPGPHGGRVRYQPPHGLGADLSADERVALARDLLRRSGYDPRTDRPLELAFPPEAEQRFLAEAIQALWEHHLGLRVELRMVEGKVLSQMIRNLDYDLARSDWFGDYLDPGTFLDMFTTADGQNRTGWSSPAYDALIAAAAREHDPARRYAAFQQAEQILTEDELPILPVFFRRGNYLLSPRFDGVRDNVRDLLQVHRARVRR
jgi:oligopeptide transport system substrate-binding protein